MDISNFDDLPWDDFKEISEKGIFEEVFKRIPKFRFEFAVDETNREALIKSALKSLRKKNPEATYEQATTLANLMATFARKILEG